MSSPGSEVTSFPVLIFFFLLASHDDTHKMVGVFTSKITFRQKQQALGWECASVIEDLSSHTQSLLDSQYCKWIKPK